MAKSKNVMYVGGTTFADMSVPRNMPVRLPIYKIKNKFYFFDKRLNEYRNVKNPSDRKDIFDVPLSSLQKFTKKDNKKLKEYL